MISDPFIRNALLAAGAILVGALAAALGALLVQLNGTDPILWRPILAAALGPIVTGLLVRQLPKAGREELGNLVTQVGVPQAKAALEDEADRQAGIPSPLDPSTVQQIVAAVKAEMVRNPSGRLAVPPAPSPPMDREAYSDTRLP